MNYLRVVQVLVRTPGGSVFSANQHDFGSNSADRAVILTIRRRTPAETREYYRYLIEEHGDWRAGHNMREAYAEIKSVPEAVYSSPAFLDRLMTGSGTFQVIGDPDEVVATFQRIHDAGVNGMAIALPSYLTDFEIIRDEVLPRMIAKGLRAATAVSPVS
jgi:alkanesulfonate monooxygenase SsuD/methylene tetrahydromethanopterin reductase-like flavin-dependent oxidoreductase (luciferase family)